MPPSWRSGRFGALGYPPRWRWHYTHFPARREQGLFLISPPTFLQLNLTQVRQIKIFLAIFKKNIIDANQSEVILGTISSEMPCSIAVLSHVCSLM